MLQRRRLATAGRGLVGPARRLDDYGMYVNQETRNSGNLRECPQSVDEDSAALIRSTALEIENYGKLAR